MNVIEFLLQKMCLDEDEMSHLLITVVSKYQTLEMLKLLIRFGAELNKGCVYLSCELGHLEKINFCYETNKTTLIFPFISELMKMASTHGHLHLIKYFESLQLIEQQQRQPNPNLKGLIEDCLTKAVSSGQLQVVKYLNEEIDQSLFGENKGIRFKISENSKLAIIASSKNNIVILKYLVDLNGARLEDEKNSKNCLLYAASNGNFEMIQYLVDEKKMDVNKIGTNGENPISSCFYASGEDIILKNIRFLIERGALVHDKTDGVGKTAISLAAFKGYLKIAKFLILEMKVNVNIVDKNGSSPLYLCCMLSRTNFEMLKLLVENGNADVNLCESKMNYSPLWISISYKNEQFARYLIEKGSDLTVYDKLSRRTPFKIAMEMGLVDLAMYIKEKGGN